VVSDHLSFGRAGLIAPETERQWSEGAGILEAMAGVADGAFTGDLFGATANGAVVVLSGLGAVTDPFQAVFAAGVGWLMEHLAILREPLDWLAGDPKEIEGHAATWRNIEVRVAEATRYFADEVASSTTRWRSLAVSAYRERAEDHAQTVQALGVAAERLAKLTLVAGAIVGVVRNTIRDLIADVVGAAISKALQAVAVVTIPKVVLEVGLLVGECSAKILKLLDRLVAAIRNLSSHLDGLSRLLDRIAKANHNVTILSGYRLEAAGAGLTRSEGTLEAYRSADRTLSQGHRAVHGSTADAVDEVVAGSATGNAIQNAGAAARDIRDGDAPPPAVHLPL
jgi:hypothetical protein